MLRYQIRVLDVDTQIDYVYKIDNRLSLVDAELNRIKEAIHIIHKYK